MTDERLAEITQAILKRGPDAVVINQKGDAVASMQARLLGLRSHILLIHSNGSTLGAPRQFAAVAESSKKNEWVAFLKRPSKVAKRLK